MRLEFRPPHPDFHPSKYGAIYLGNSHYFDQPKDFLLTRSQKLFSLCAQVKRNLMNAPGMTRNEKQEKVLDAEWGIVLASRPFDTCLETGGARESENFPAVPTGATKAFRSSRFPAAGFFLPYRTNGCGAVNQVPPSDQRCSGKRLSLVFTFAKSQGTCGKRFMGCQLRCVIRRASKRQQAILVSLGNAALAERGNSGRWSLNPNHLGYESVLRIAEQVLMCQIPVKLPNSKEVLFASVSPEDFDRLSAHKWYLHNGKYAARYSRRTENPCNAPRIRLMHRDILGDGNYQADHIDGNGLNNKRENLRRATRSQNGANRHKKPDRGRKNSSIRSRYRGVVFSKNPVNPWMAMIRVNKKPIYLGYFNNEVDAAIAYNRAAIIHFGEFASINRIENENTHAN